MNNIKSASVCIWVVLSFMVVAMLVMKNQTEDLEKELYRINNVISEDARTIHILKAEWSHLNNPERLRSLAQKHIELNPVKAEQLINYAALPFDYEVTGDNRKMLARQNLNSRALQNRELRKMAKVQR